MKIIKKMNDCFVALALTTFVCVGPGVMPALAASLEDPDQTEEPLVSTQEAGEAEATSADAAVEEAPVEEKDEPVANEAAADEAPADEATAPTEVTPAENASDQVVTVAADVDPHTFEVATADELKSAFEKIDSDDAGTYTVNMTADITASDNLTVTSGKTIDLNGNGHTLTLNGDVTLGTNGGTLNLNGTLTVTAAGAHSKALVTANGGTLNMSDGVTITGNANGGVTLSNKATFNMNGGTVENCQAHQGGGVYMDKQTKFTMSGDATIRDNKASNVGGGVYVNNMATFTMEGNASIVDNSADAAGGVMNYGMATLTTVYNNTSHSGAADIFNYGRMKLSPTNPDWVLTSTGTNVTGWYIDNYSKTDADGNQADGKHRWNPALDDTVEYTPSDGVTTERLHLIAGAPLPEEPRVDVTWLNEDGTVLYQMTDVKVSEIPAADEYTELSGNATPTESYDDDLKYTFEDWAESKNADGDVTYTAEYDAVPDYAPVVPDDLVDIEEPDVPSTPEDPTVVPGDNPANVPSTHDDPAAGPENSDNTNATEHEDENNNGMNTQDESDDGKDDADSSTASKMNDAGMAVNLAAAGGMAAGLAGLAYIKHRRNEEEQ